MSIHKSEITGLSRARWSTRMNAALLRTFPWHETQVSIDLPINLLKPLERPSSVRRDYLNLLSTSLSPATALRRPVQQRSARFLCGFRALTTCSRYGYRVAPLLMARFQIIAPCCTSARTVPVNQLEPHEADFRRTIRSRDGIGQ